MPISLPLREMYYKFSAQRLPVAQMRCSVVPEDGQCHIISFGNNELVIKDKPNAPKRVLFQYLSHVNVITVVASSVEILEFPRLTEVDHMEFSQCHTLTELKFEL